MTIPHLTLPETGRGSWGGVDRANCLPWEITQRETVNRGMNAVPSIRQLFQLRTVSQIIRMQIEYISAMG